MNNLPHKKRNFNHFTLNERKLIQKLSRNGLSSSSIARLLDRHRSSISRQLNNKSNTDFVKVGSKVKRLCVASKAQLNYETNKSNCGAKYKLLEDKKLITYIEDCVVDKNCNSIFVLTERLTRYGLMIKLKQHTTAQNFTKQQNLKTKISEYTLHTHIVLMKKVELKTLTE